MTIPPLRFLKLTSHLHGYRSGHRFLRTFSFYYFLLFFHRILWCFFFVFYISPRLIIGIFMNIAASSYYILQRFFKVK
jgi:hypothetical protein